MVGVVFRAAECVTRRRGGGVIGLRRASLRAVLVAALASCVPGERDVPTGAIEPREGHVEVEPGVRLYYTAMGEGEPTVLVPAALFLLEPLRGLATGRTVLFYDMRDRGRSGAVEDTSRIGIRDDVRDLEALRRHFGLDRIQLVGWSYLGLVAAMYAFEHPERVERLVQIGPIPPRADPPYADPGAYAAAVAPDALERLRRLAEEGMPEREPARYYGEYWRVFKPALFGDTSVMRRYELPPADLSNEWVNRLEPHFQAKFASMGGYDWRHAAAGLSVPVLVVHGSADRNAPPAGGREWAVSFGNARFFGVDGAGHLPMVEQPDLVLPVLDRFLSGTWPQGAVVLLH